ncbi:3-oxoacyl-[acyl-carrier-protein] synthase-3 [Nonomuraea solani]|uniref:3-oxoacyl-[acyl-carrier-protein] synthase-3 n=1 Tax=Nonomuraea solani TaxID=1144553 RepID=A0A1H6EEK0_9ACTN|nr:ketoacyl-ACP synthase III [Nonomuraea solani]SEG95449.1 3-oxoacyl-[acyl-carrier-protein] synthase-3 [Nonomuraea solani]
MPTDTRVGVLTTGTCIPADVRTNEEVADAANVTPDWIAERTGIRRRHVAPPGHAASDLAAEAVRRALEPLGRPPGDIDLLVLATSTPDELGPSTACRVQALLGADRAVAFDVAAACSGWMFGARVACDWLRGGNEDKLAVVVGVEAYSRFLDPEDRATSVLFGDGAAATVLGRVPDGGFDPIVLGSDGTDAGTVLIPGGGSRIPASSQSLADKDHVIHMDGGTVRDFTLKIFPEMVAAALERGGLKLGDIDLVVSHQPNPVLLSRAAAELGLPEDRLMVVGHEVGNIGAASLPYALARAAGSDRLRPGDRVLLVAFGAGLTWGSTILTWSRSFEGASS